MSLNIISKESFFLDVLVPTGVVAELFLQKMASKTLKRDADTIGTLVWDPLNLVSHYVLSNQVTSQTLLPLRRAVTHFRTILVNLLTGKQPSTTRKFGRYLNSVDIQAQLGESINCIKSLIGLDGNVKKEAWVQAHANPQVPTALANLSKWRTFARHLDPGKMMNDLGVRELYKEAEQLSNKDGKDAARKLWQECFAGPASGVENRSAQGTVPDGIEVEVLPSRFLKVTARFEPGTHLGIKGDVSHLPKDLITQLLVQHMHKECGYTELVSTIEEGVVWQADQMKTLPKLKVAYEAALEQIKSEDLVKKLKSSFSPEEIALLQKHLAA
jgi:hypothetical protein